MRTYTDYPMRAGTILGFCTATTDHLNYIRQDMGLTLPAELLSHIQNHYRLFEKRDCDASELILIDILFANAKKKIASEHNYCISEMVTDNEEIRETMEDMMAKLAAMEKAPQGPIPFERMINISSDYMASIFPERASEHFSVKYVGEDAPELHARLDGSRKIMSCSSENIKFAAASSPVKSKIKEGVYIQIKNEGDVFSFIDDLMKKGIIFNGWMIDDDLILTVLSDTRSAELTVPDMLPEMATYGRGDILLLCREKDEMAIVHMGMERELKMRRAGKKRKKGKILFKCKEKTTAIDANFLLKFAKANVLSPVSLNISDEVLSGKPSCKLNELSCDGYVNSLSAICASSDMSAPYRSGISQVLCAAAGQIALGSSIEDIRLKTVVFCPKDTAAAKIFAHILGIYRAEAELCLSSHQNELHVSDDIRRENSFSIALAKTRSEGTFGEGSLFVISPEEKDGKICFANVRKAFSYVTALLESGHVIRACALDSEGLSDSTDEKKTFSAGSFLILTNAELLCCEGVTVTYVGVVGNENTLPIV